ncbi:MAG TPA: carbohydrate kinase family protein [Candidatus Ventricola intestinavium]|nr:carbohydrate kinase family protein [Candidatus Ventricola intestinavium]
MHTKNVLVIGSTCVDVILRIDHLPRTEENLHPESQRFAIGGCAYNVANILGRARVPITFVTPVGERGVFGGFVRRQLDALGFADPVYLPDAENGCCYCFVEKSGERTFMSIHGAEYTFDPSWMAPYAKNRYAYGYVCGLEVEERTGGQLVHYLEDAPVDTLLYAPGPRGMRVPPEWTDRLFSLHPMLHLNAGEARALSGCDSLDDAMRALHARTGSPVIATLGAEGARCLDARGLYTVPGVRVQTVVDTIGAGDAHAGATLLGLCRGLSLPDAVALANRVCAKVVQTDGSTLSDEDFASLGLV